MDAFDDDDWDTAFWDDSSRTDVQQTHTQDKTSGQQVRPYVPHLQARNRPAANTQIQAQAATYFATFQEASAWAMQHHGSAFVRSPDGNGFVPVVTRGALPAGRGAVQSRSAEQLRDKRSEGVSPRRPSWEDEEPPF